MPAPEAMSPDAREMRPPQPVEFSTEEDWTDFWVAFWRNNGMGDSGASESKRRTAAYTAKQTMRDQRARALPSYGFGMREDGQMIATSRLEVREDDDGERYGYLFHLSVDEAHRGQGLARRLTEVREERARQDGCTRLVTDVFSGNPVALVSKLHEGYAVTDMKPQEMLHGEPPAGVFVVSKRLDNASATEDEQPQAGERRDVSLTDLGQVQELLDEGWHGVDAKNFGGPQDTDPVSWILVMEKPVA